MVPQGGASLRLVADSMDRKLEATIDSQGELTVNIQPQGTKFSYRIAEHGGGRSLSGQGEPKPAALLLEAGRNTSDPAQLETLYSWPLTMSGDGFKRLFALASRLASSDARFMLIEEPETFLHVGALPQVARLLWEATSPQPAGPDGTRPPDRHVIVTTHSLEYLDAQFLSASDEELSRAALVRLSLRQGLLKAVRIDGPKVKELREEIGEDLRR